MLIESLKEASVYTESTFSTEALEVGCSSLLEATLDFEMGFNEAYLEQISSELNESYLSEEEKEAGKVNFFEKIKQFFVSMVENVKNFFRNVYNKFVINFKIFVNVIEKCIKIVSSSKKDFNATTSGKVDAKHENEKDLKITYLSPKVIDLVNDIKSKINKSFSIQSGENASLEKENSATMAASDGHMDTLLNPYIATSTLGEYSNKQTALTILNNLKKTIIDLTDGIKTIKSSLDSIIKTSNTSISILDRLKAKKDDAVSKEIEGVKRNRTVVSSANKFTSKLMSILVTISKRNATAAKRIASVYNRGGVPKKEKNKES